MKSYYRVSMKFRRQLLDAVSAGLLKALEEKLPECVGGSAPDDWSQSLKEKFDIASEVETRVCREIERCLLKGY